MMRAVSLTAGLLDRLQRARRADLPFSEPAGARAWIEALPADRPREVNKALAAAITAFCAHSSGPSTQIAVLEVLRPRIHVVQAELARQYRGAPAPLGPELLGLVDDILALWTLVANAYLGFAQGWSGRLGRHDKNKEQATALHRALDATSRLIAEHYSAYRLPPETVYSGLHALYLTAEHLDLIKVRVPDPFQALGETRCRDAWVRALLIDGCLPREHHHRELGLIFRLLERWAPKVRVVEAEEDAEDGTASLFVDLQEACGLRPWRGAGDNVRTLRMGALANEIRQTLTILRKGGDIPDLDFGPGLSRRDFERLLLLLHRQWCEGGIRRTSERQSAATAAHVSSGLRAAHFYLGRKPFEQPFEPSSLPSRGNARRSEHSAQRVRAATDYLQAHGIRAEQWQIKDESPSGLGMTRGHDEPGEPWIGQGLLLAVRPIGHSNTLVGTVRWIQADKDGALQIGVSLLPGIPVAIAARIPAASEFEPAILMLPLPAANAPSSLVMAPGLLKPRMVVDIYREGIDRIEITALLEGGTEFERFAFMPAGSVYDPSTEYDPSR